MATIEIEIKIPNGELPTGSDPAAFEQELTSGLKQLGKTYKELTLEEPIIKPAPAGSAGVYESIEWLIRHHGEIHDALSLLKDLIATTSTAALAYMKIHQEVKKMRDNKHLGATVTLKVGKASLALPSSEGEKTAFLSIAAQELKKKTSK